MDFNFVLITDLLAFIIISILLVVYLIKIRKYFSRAIHLFLFFFIISVFFHHFSNFLEWVLLINILDFFEDYAEILTPFLLLLFLYSYNQEIVKNRLKQNREDILNAYKTSEFYKDLFTHDINNVLQGIMSASQLARKFLESDNLEEAVDLYKFIKNQLFKGARLVSNAKNLSELEKIAPNLYGVELNEVLLEEIKNLKEFFKDKDIKIRKNNPEGIILIKANKYIDELFKNLLINSIVHNNEEKIKIIINIFRINNDYIKVEIEDNGKGIKDEQKELILSNNHSSTRTGLGLILVKKVIESINAKFWIEDKVEGDPLQGCRIIMIFEEFIKEIVDKKKI